MRQPLAIWPAKGRRESVKASRLRIEAKETGRSLIDSADFLQNGIEFRAGRQDIRASGMRDMHRAGVPILIAQHKKPVFETRSEDNRCRACCPVDPDRRIVIRHPVELRIAEPGHHKNAKRDGDDEQTRRADGQRQMGGCSGHLEYPSDAEAFCLQPFKL